MEVVITFIIVWGLAITIRNYLQYKIYIEQEKTKQLQLKDKVEK